MKKILCAFATLIFTQLSFSIGEASAQSWQWGKRGGTNVSGINSTDIDELKVLATDANGNSYILSTVFTNKVSGTIDIDGNKIGSGNGDKDICLTSFDCSGKFRWNKILGGKKSDVACDVKTDTLGGVYISGNFFAGSMFDSVAIATDTMLRSPTVAPFRFYQSLFIIKFDTSGNYKWLRMPEPDTMSISKYSRSISMEVDKAGNISMLTCINHSGAFAKGSYIVPISTALPSMHILKYDANGNFIKGFPLDISEGEQISLFRIRMVWDYKADVYYLMSLNIGTTGVNYPKFGTAKMTGTNCLSKFSNTGANIWVKQSSTTSYTGVLSSTPVLDADGNIYISTSEYGGGNFLGHSIVNKLGGLAVPCVFKVSPSGILVWGKSGSASTNTQAKCISVSNKGEIAFAGNVNSKMYWDTDSMFAVPSNIFFIRLNASTGATIAIDSVRGGDYEEAQSLVADRNGNFYLGGYFKSTLEINGVTTLTKYGGQTDFFIAKFGEADCKEPVSINESVTANSSIKIYPNPAQDVITFEGLENGSEVRLFSVLGQQVQSFVAKSNKEQLAISHLARGMYLVQIHNADGAVYSAKIVKE
ncbi:MAG: T9SS type A sorting domain-containing protein [Phycisphaerales bacterium]|nr:T9SS type A sorting domain-containing protein [Phycisphaerales bacterium]